MFPCPRRFKFNKGQKCNHSRPLNYPNIKNLFSNLHLQTPGLSAPKRMLLKHLCYNYWLHSFLSPRVYIYIIGVSHFQQIYMCADIDVNMDSCIHATSFWLWVSTLKCAITVVWALVILGTLGSQRFSRSMILEETLDIISFMWVHWGTWENSRGHHEMGVVLGNVLIQIPFPKHLFTPRTPYVHIRTGF